MKAFLKIERCGEVFSVRSEKAEQGTISKRVVTFKQTGGDIERLVRAVPRPLRGGDAGSGGRGGHPSRRHYLRRAALPNTRPQRADLSGHHAGELCEAGK